MTFNFILPRAAVCCGDSFQTLPDVSILASILYVVHTRSFSSFTHRCLKTLLGKRRGYARLRSEMGGGDIWASGRMNWSASEFLWPLKLPYQTEIPLPTGGPVDAPADISLVRLSHRTAFCCSERLWGIPASWALSCWWVHAFPFYWSLIKIMNKCENMFDYEQRCCSVCKQFLPAVIIFIYSKLLFSEQTFADVSVLLFGWRRVQNVFSRPAQLCVPEQHWAASSCLQMCNQ